MRKGSKLKTVHPPKGNLKISNFFHKTSTETSRNKILDPVTEIVPNSATLNAIHDIQSPELCEKNIKKSCSDVSSRCDNCESNTIFQFHHHTLVKEHTIVHDIVPASSTNIADEDYDNIYSNKKRKLHSPNDENSFTAKRKNSPSMVSIKGEGYIKIKTPDKLFPSTTINDCSSEDLSKAKELTHIQTPLKNHDVNINMANSNKTPSKIPKKSPKQKLFDKSPAKLEDFNVEIINKFVKITPSKSNRKMVSTKSPETSSKKQMSILQYVSPGNSSSQKAQKLNETTPKKENPVEKSVTSPSVSKAKLRLDFSTCSKVETKTKDEGLCLDSEFAGLDGEFENDWDAQFNGSPECFNLDLQEPQHCQVIESIVTKNRIIIKTQSTSSKEKAICHLEGFWVSLRIKPNDIVYLQAAKNTDGDWVINNEFGLLVYEPDFLISSTTVAQSVGCIRRGVLREKYQGFEPTNRVMVIGIFVHTLLQHTLRNNLQTASEVENIMEEIISTNAAIRRMYEASLSIKNVKEELRHFIPKIVDFVKDYVGANATPSNIKLKNPQIKPWNGKIDSVDDIEENIWCPQLGIKGKVDVSIRSKDKIYPLELKTGRASMSLEHKGQVILYVMMMNTLGYQISSGLLHYLKEGLLTEVSVTHKESRDIMILRNELAHFLTRKPFDSDHEKSSKDININSATVSRQDDNKSESQQITVQELPEPIDVQTFCSKCSYNVICSSYIPYESHDIALKNNFSKIQKESISHLEKVHLDYFIKWSFLLSLESKSQKDTKSIREIYTVPPSKRAEEGRCICNVNLTKVEAKADSLFEHTFQRNNVHSTNFLISGIDENSYVVVSTDNRSAVSSGFVKNITAQSVIIILDRDLRKKYSNDNFHIDTYDSLVSTSFNMSSLALLLENSPRANCLRKIIIEKEPPTFLPKLPKMVAMKSLPILKRLNKSQQRAVLKSLSAKDYLLIKGMPGTGKTETIVALVQLLVEVNKTVLITSHTHSAIDNVCVRLQKYGIHVLRLGSASKINEKIKSNSEYVMTQNCKTPEEIEKIYNEASVIAVTCLGSGHPLLSKRVLDVCLVDESTQVIQPSVFRGICCAKTFILIGDPEQLSPTVRNKEASKRGMSESLFERLQNPETCVALDQNYRMNKTITALANALTYDGELLIGNETVGNAHLKIPNEDMLNKVYCDQSWILKVLDTSLEFAVQIIDTNIKDTMTDLTQLDNKSYVNIYEAAIVVKLVKVLLEGGVSNEHIGVIATYRDQVAYISKFLVNVDVSTVDQFQGKDKNVILYSCTKYNTNPNVPVHQFNLLEDHKRLTVAVTRAKHKLIIIGEVAVMERYKPFAKMLNSLDKSKFLKLENEKLGFRWNSILDS